jgi:hypothetical protein
MVQRTPVSPPQLHSSQVTDRFPLFHSVYSLNYSQIISTTMTDSTDTDRYFTELNSNSPQGECMLQQPDDTLLTSAEAIDAMIRVLAEAMSNRQSGSSLAAGHMVFESGLTAQRQIGSLRGVAPGNN